MRKWRLINNNRALSIIEFLITATIMVLIIGGSLFVYLASSAAWKEGYTQIKLQQEASIAMEKMVRGVGGQNGIREASSVSISIAQTSIQYASGGSNRRFELSGSEIKYDSNTSDSSNPLETIAEYVDSLTFTEPSSGLVKIDLRLLEDIGDKNIYIDLSTQVTLRND